MEQKKQIDYDSLEWFDCKNNFPPMSIDLYVDSEHGYGIGRLGRRVKDKSIIWTVHLDSGDVYQVYAFYKVKRWAYMPKDEKTNTKLKYELMLNKERSWVPCYLKYDVDKHINELEESHKKEVEQLLIEIAEKDAEIAGLKAAVNEPRVPNRTCRKCGSAGTLMYMPIVKDGRTYWDLYNNRGIDYVFGIQCAHCGETAFVTKQTHEYEIRKQKHKRCLAMAKWCERKRVDAANYRIPREKWEFYEKWHNRWIAIAKKFKEL